MKTIPLTQGYVALVDDDDYESISQFKWHVLKSGQNRYACRRVRQPDGTQGAILMHRFLLPTAEYVDHIKGNGLDNRRECIRACTQQQNCAGFARKRPGASSSFRGVSWNEKSQKWEAQIQRAGIKYHLGGFLVETEAAQAYLRAAKSLI